MSSLITWKSIDGGATWQPSKDFVAGLPSTNLGGAIALPFAPAGLRVFLNGIRLLRDDTGGVDFKLDDFNIILSLTLNLGDVIEIDVAVPGTTMALTFGEVPTMISSTVYQLSATPSDGSVCVFLNGIRLEAGIDYSVSTDQITFATITPGGSDVLLVDYLT